MTEPYFPLPVQAFFAVGFASRKGQPLESLGRDLRDTACCGRAAAVLRSGRSLPTTRASQAPYFKAGPPESPASLSFSTLQKPPPPPSSWLEGIVWSRSSRLLACIQRNPQIGGLIAASA